MARLPGNPTVLQRRQLAFENFDQVRAELDVLRQGGYERAGHWDLAQACDHLSCFIEAPVDGATFKVPWILKVLFGRMVLKRILSQKKMKAGVPTPQKPAPGGDERAAVDRLKRAIDRLQNHNGEVHPHPFFGEMTPEQARELQLIHCAHHLSYLVPKAATT